jgi:putative flavoprotein involved in K+ transport
MAPLGMTVSRGRNFEDPDHDAFVGKEKVADFIVQYAAQIAAPIRCGVTVQRAYKLENRASYVVQPSDGDFEVNHIVAATGAFQHPVMPKLIPEETAVTQIHSNRYRNPDQLPQGAVMVIGAGSSGAQIAQELMEAVRRCIFLSGPTIVPRAAIWGPRLLLVVRGCLENGNYKHLRWGRSM